MSCGGNCGSWVSKKIPSLTRKRPSNARDEGPSQKKDKLSTSGHEGGPSQRSEDRPSTGQDGGPSRRSEKRPASEDEEPSQKKEDLGSARTRKRVRTVVMAKEDYKTITEEEALEISDLGCFAETSIQEEKGELFKLDNVVETPMSYSCHILPAPRILQMKPYYSLLKLVAMNPCFGLMALGCEDSTCQIWDISRGKPMNPGKDLNHSGKKEGPPVEHGKNITALEWSPHGFYLATGCMDGKVRIWSRLGELKSDWEQDGLQVVCLRWSPTGEKLATSGPTGEVYVWTIDDDGRNMQFKFRFIHTDKIGDLDWLGLDVLGMCSKDGRWSIYSFRDDEDLRTFKGEHNGEICCIKFGPLDSRYLATSCKNGQVKVWHWDGTLHDSLRGHQGPVWALQWAPKKLGINNKNILASGSLDRTVMIWDIKPKNQGGCECLRVIAGHGDGVADLAFTPDAALLATSCWDGYVRVWSTHCGQLQHSHRTTGMQYKLSWNGMGDKLAVAYSIRDVGNAVVLNYEGYHHADARRFKNPTKPCRQGPGRYDINPYDEPVHKIIREH